MEFGVSQFFQHHMGYYNLDSLVTASPQEQDTSSQISDRQVITDQTENLVLHRLEIDCKAIFSEHITVTGIHMRLASVVLK